jgi:hypothetical protein
VGAQGCRRQGAGRGAPVSLTEDPGKQLSGSDNTAGRHCRRCRPDGPVSGSASRGSIPASKWHYRAHQKPGTPGEVMLFEVPKGQTQMTPARRHGTKPAVVVEAPDWGLSSPAAEPSSNGHIPNAGGSNPPLGSGSSGIRELRRVTGNLYRNGRSGGFGALRAPATKLPFWWQWVGPALVTPGDSRAGIPNLTFRKRSLFTEALMIIRALHSSFRRD